MQPDPYVSALRRVADAANEYMGARMLFEAGGSPFEFRPASRTRGATKALCRGCATGQIRDCG